MRKTVLYLPRVLLVDSLAASFSSRLVFLCLWMCFAFGGAGRWYVFVAACRLFLIPSLIVSCALFFKDFFGIVCDLRARGSVGFACSTLTLLSILPSFSV